VHAQTMAQMAYSRASAPVRTDRGTEYDLFARVTRALKSADDRGKAGFRDLAEAIHENRRLWALLAGDVASEDNSLPQELRARIFYLAEFTHQHSQKVLGGKAGARVLVEINAAVMKGLRAGVGR